MAGGRLKAGAGPRVHRLPDAPSVARAVAEHLVRKIEASLARHARCRIALAGGSTPGPVYERLAEPELAGRIQWPRVEIFFGDERSVPPDDPGSNYRMVEASLLRHLPSPPRRVHRIQGELPAGEAAAAYERALGDEPLDVVLLGMGEDGHTASLFPGRPEAEDTTSRVVPAIGASPPRERVTLTLRALAEARTVCFVVTGAGKAARVAEVLAQIEAGEPRLPAARVHPSSGDLHWFLDDGAARDLPNLETESTRP